jgi:phenylacetate-coenzyme A ligase PaaK-like adenylate-forming protein
VADDDPKAAYERLRAAHLTAVRASLEDHVAGLDWPHQRIERYQTERLRSLLAYARERSPFHAARMANIDPATATIDDLTNSEPLSEEDRDAITIAWAAPVHNLWGSTEIGVQAVCCGYGEGLHICEDEVILERVDSDGRPVPSDEPAAGTLATGLAGRTFPFIRYDLGDEVTLLLGRCACGSPILRVADIAGQRDDDFHYGERLVPASAFRYVLGTDPLISECAADGERRRCARYRIARCLGGRGSAGLIAGPARAL